MRMTLTAAPITSAGRFPPLGPLGIRRISRFAVSAESSVGIAQQVPHERFRLRQRREAVGPIRRATTLVLMLLPFALTTMFA